MRDVRPRAEVVGLDVTDTGARIHGRLIETGADSLRLDLVGKSRHSQREFTVPVDNTADAFTVDLRWDDVARASGMRHDTMDLRLQVRQSDKALPDLRLRRPPAADDAEQPLPPPTRVALNRYDVDVEPYYTVSSSLAIRLGAGTPPGATARRPYGRRPAPPVVRRLVESYFQRTERRNAAGRGAGTPPLGEQRPRVYFLIRSIYGMGGTIRTVLNVATYLVDQGYRVHIVSLLRRHRTFFPVDGRIRLEGVIDERIREHGLLSIGLTRNPLGGAAQWALAKLLDRWESVLTHPKENVFADASLLTDVLLVRKLQRLKPGVLVLTRPVLNVTGARFAKPATRTIGQEHMNFPLRPPEVRAWMLANYSKLDVLTVLTTGDERDYRNALGDSGVDIRTLPNGLPRLPDAIADPDAKVVIAAGRLTKQKGFDRLIPAFAKVVERHPDWELRIFGDGPLEDNLQRQIDALGVAQSIRLMGRTGEMAKEMARGSIYAMSSRFEGFPMVLVEAMGAGLPVVSFDCPRGPADIVEPGKNGLLAPPGDVDALAAALITVIGDPALRRSMAVAARATAADYSMERLGLRWQDLLRHLGTTARPAAPNA